MNWLDVVVILARGVGVFVWLCLCLGLITEAVDRLPERAEVSRMVIVTVGLLVTFGGISAFDRLVGL